LGSRRQAHVANLQLHAGAKILDVGCGTGASALPAAQAVGKNGSVVGVDLASRLLDRARAKALAAGLDNVEFRLADMTTLNYPDESFDSVVSVFSIFFVPDMEGLVRELWRMVRPGGKLAVTTWGPRFCKPAYARWFVALGKERPDLVNAFNPWDRITDVMAVRKLLQDGGVKDAEVIPEDGVQPLRPCNTFSLALCDRAASGDQGGCPLWVISGLFLMSALPPKADIREPRTMALRAKKVATAASFLIPTY
jgi:SAM-dependent methyltransferase